MVFKKSTFFEKFVFVFASFAAIGLFIRGIVVDSTVDGVLNYVLGFIVCGTGYWYTSHLEKKYSKDV